MRRLLFILSMSLLSYSFVAEAATAPAGVAPSVGMPGMPPSGSGSQMMMDGHPMINGAQPNSCSPPSASNPQPGCKPSSPPNGRMPGGNRGAPLPPSHDQSHGTSSGNGATE